jgi:hypothetical protein
VPALREKARPAVRYEVGVAMQSLVRVVAITVAIGSVIFAAIQTRILARQTKMLQTTTELSYNLELMVRLNEVLFQISDERRSRVYVWGKVGKQNSRSGHEGRALLDVLDAAVSGSNRLLKFRDSHFEDWVRYTEYVLERSRSLRDEVRDHPTWWPNIAPILERQAHRV